MRVERKFRTCEDKKARVNTLQGFLSFFFFKRVLTYRKIRYQLVFCIREIEPYISYSTIKNFIN